jgi:hypothetical protein
VGKIAWQGGAILPDREKILPTLSTSATYDRVGHKAVFTPVFDGLWAREHCAQSMVL